MFTPEIEIIYANNGIKRLKPSTDGSAGYDLQIDYAYTMWLHPGMEYTFSTGVSVHIKDPKYAALIIPRSGLGTRGLVIANTVGLIDSDYNGEIKMGLFNRSFNNSILIDPFMRVAQMIFIPVVHPIFKEVEKFSETTKRGCNGFGSTGVK